MLELKTIYLIQDIIKIKDFSKIVKPLYDVLQKKKRSNKMVKDPFRKAIFQGYYSMSEEDIKNNDEIRQGHIRLSMKLGKFHEDITSYFEGYEKLIKDETGCDVATTDRKKYYEIKNSSTTMNHDSKKSVLNKLQRVYSKYEAKPYLVIINGTPIKVNNKNIIVLSGKKHYEILTGKIDFYDKLSETLLNIFTIFNTYEKLENFIDSLEEV